jgi:hypothetical protein
MLQECENLCIPLNMSVFQQTVQDFTSICHTAGHARLAGLKNADLLLAAEADRIHYLVFELLLYQGQRHDESAS